MTRSTVSTEWLQRIRAEYSEIPDLRLTEEQARRLWRLEPEMKQFNPPKDDVDALVSYLQALKKRK
jgi:hypothetical protein